MGKGAPIPCSSLKKAAIIVAVVEVILCILAVYGLFRNLQLFGSSYLLWFLLGIISVPILLLAIGLMLYAIKFEKPRWLIPHMSAQIFLIIFLIVVAFVVLLLLIFGAYRGIRNLLGVFNYSMSDDSTFFLGVLLIVIHIIVAILEIVFFYLIYKLYKHMKSYKKMQEGMSWQGALPRDNHHGAPTMGHVYPYGTEGTGQQLNSDEYNEEY